MNKKQILLSSLALLLILIFVVSCAPPRRPGEAQPGGPEQTRFFPRLTPRRPGPAPAPGQPAPGPAPAPQRAVPPGPAPARPAPAPGGVGQGARQPGQDALMERAENIAQTVAQEDEIDSATCVITGNTALVGVQFDEQYRGQLTDRIKQRIDQRVRQEDERVTRVVVTADPRPSFR